MPMLKKLFVVSCACLFLSGCGTPQPTVEKPPTPPVPGSIYKSFDAGRTFVPKITVDEKRRITSADVLVWAFHPTDPQTMYIGTASDGIFRTTDGAEHWEPMTFPPERVYGLAIDPSNPDRIFATGIYEKVAKVYRTEDAGVNWKEVYVEPGPGTVISSFAMHPTDSRILYAATDKGVVIKSSDGGEQWKNVYEAAAPVTKILIGSKVPEAVSLLVFQKGIIFSGDGGLTWADPSKNAIASALDTAVSPGAIVSIAADPSTPSTLYAGGTGGMYRSLDFGKTWSAVEIIESAKQYPIRAIAINPQNPSEIIFAAGAAFYRSTDGGERWSVTELGIKKGVSTIVYEPGNSDIIYFGIRSFK